MRRRDKKIEDNLKRLLVKGKAANLDLDEHVILLKEFYDNVIAEFEDELKDLRAKQKSVNHDLIEELWETYPQYLSETISGNKAIARGLGSHTMSQLSEIYCKDINNDKHRHEQIKQLIEWGIKNKMIRMGFGNFIYLKDYVRLETDYLKGKKAHHGDDI